MNIRTVRENGASLKASYRIPTLPLPDDPENKTVLRKVKEASRALAELKGFASTMPNQAILINTLSLQEAKDSSAIESIVTTHDELYQSDIALQQFASQAAGHVHLYASALRNGYGNVKNGGLLTNALIKAIQQEPEGNDAGFRSQAGTALKKILPVKRSILRRSPCRRLKRICRIWSVSSMTTALPTWTL